MNVETGSLEKTVKVSWNNLWSLVFYVCVFVIITMTSPWIISISCKELPQALSLLIFNFFQNFFLWYYGFSSCVVFPSKRLWIISISWAVDFLQFFQCITIRKALLTRENLCCWTCQQAVLESLFFQSKGIRVTTNPVWMEPPAVMTIKMFHCITVTAPTATAGKTVRVGGFSKTTNYIRKSFCSTIDIFRPN